LRANQQTGITSVVVKMHIAAYIYDITRRDDCCAGLAGMAGMAGQKLLQGPSPSPHPPTKTTVHVVALLEPSGLQLSG